MIKKVKELISLNLPQNDSDKYCPKFGDITHLVCMTMEFSLHIISFVSIQLKQRRELHIPIPLPSLLTTETF